MNESVREPEPKKRQGCGLVVFTLVSLVMLFLFVTASPHSWPWYRGARNTERKRTEIIFMTLRTGVELEIANKGSISLTFEGLCTALKNSGAYAELKSLKAIDQEQQRFVDGWGRPIEIVSDAQRGIVLLSCGSDGIAGNKDDLRSGDTASQ